MDGAMSGLAKALSRIEDPAARKIVIMSKWERGEITAKEAERLIRELGLGLAGIQNDLRPVRRLHLFHPLR
jgi:hypothetical protein